jgi:hypothetical protein
MASRWRINDAESFEPTMLMAAKKGAYPAAKP